MMLSIDSGITWSTSLKDLVKHYGYSLTRADVDSIRALEVGQSVDLGHGNLCEQGARITRTS